jgi:pimeloyl-ACP methyl ester carboxylesterase
LVLVALNDIDGREYSEFRAISKPGHFALRIGAAETYLFVFEDLNMDFRLQDDEQYGWASNGQHLNAAQLAGENVEISIGSNDGPSIPHLLVGRSLLDHVEGNRRFSIGTVTPLDDELLSLEFAKKGLWQPYVFLEAGGAGIHFMEPYDPDRIPVLFVHGIQGAPANFEPLIANLDLTKYQPWYFSYPSGLRLSLIANGMFQFIEVVQRRYSVKSLHIVAHSMGGLVSRGALNLCIADGDCDYVESLTTISTPWNGVASAKAGVEWAPTVVPVWRDMDPDSDFVMTMFDRPLPSKLPHNLLFGFHVDSFFGADSSDGVVTLASQLRQEAQAGASVIRGYDEGHVSILGNNDVADLVNALMNDEQRQSE